MFTVHILLNKFKFVKNHDIVMTRRKPAINAQKIKLTLLTRKRLFDDYNAPITRFLG